MSRYRNRRARSVGVLFSFPASRVCKNSMRLARTRLLSRSHAPAWECIPALPYRHEFRAATRLRYGSHGGPWEPGRLSPRSHAPAWECRSALRYRHEFRACIRPGYGFPRRTVGTRAVLVHLVPTLQRGNADRRFRTGMSFAPLLGLGMGSHGGPWEPGKLHLVPTLRRGNAYRRFCTGMSFASLLGLGMGSHGGPWEPERYLFRSALYRAVHDKAVLLAAV